MSPNCFGQAINSLPTSSETLARILGREESLTEAYSLGLEPVSLKLDVWLDFIAQVHEDLANQMPVGLGVCDTLADNNNLLESGRRRLFHFTGSAIS